MMRRGLVFGVLLFVTGLVIGMVLTGRTRSGTESTATPLVAAASHLAPPAVAATSNLPDFSDFTEIGRGDLHLAAHRIVG